MDQRDAGTPDGWPAPYARDGALRADATIRLPGSKSLTNRELILAALATGPSVVARALRSRDTELMASALTALGSHVDADDEDWKVTPGIGDRADGPSGPIDIDCGLAGTVMRFAPPAAALSRAIVRFDGDPHARTRPMAQVIAALRHLGADIDDRERLPFAVRGVGRVRGGVVQLDASASSQFISALLLAAPRYDDGVDVRHVGKPVPSLPHLDMTVACLRAHGVEVDDADANRWRVFPGTIEPRDVTIEPDLSNAAPFLMLALTGGGTIRVPGWPRSTTQPGDALRDLLTRMGAEISLEDPGTDGLTIRGGGEIEGIDVDLHEFGELTPAVAALCALATSPSHLRGVAHIRGHETDRLRALATELSHLGAEVTERPDGLDIRPAALHGGLFRTYADHRMAHAGVILGSAVPGVFVEDIGTTAKTFPGFAAAWSGLFA